MKLIKNIKNTSILLLFILLFSWGCSTSPKKTIYMPCDDIVSFEVLKDNDTINIYKHYHEQDKAELIYKMYLRNARV